MSNARQTEVDVSHTFISNFLCSNFHECISATISSCFHILSKRVLFALICILLHIILGLISSMIKIIVPDHLIFDFKTGCMISSLTFASNLCSLPGAFLYHYHFPYQSLIIIIIININIIIIILLTFKFLKIE